MYYNTETGDFGLHEGDVRSYFEQAGILVIWPEPFAPRLPASKLALLLMCALSLSALTGCSSAPTAEPPLIARKPKPTPLPAAISRIKPQPSTASLQKASEWSQNSEALLNSETPK